MIDFDFGPSPEVCEPQAAYQANRELNLAWEIVEETGANLFLTGRAGTGKTTFLKKLREDSMKRMVVLAPTGVAAINAAGNTIHSFFQLPFSPYVPGKGFITADRKYLNMSKQKKRLIASLSLLVIDEISMVRPDVLDAIDSLLRRLRNSGRPFGGLQLLLIGDLRQLPPVVKESEWNLLKEHYATPYFFESHALKKAGFQTVELSMVYRQSDARFLDILNAIRDGKATPQILEELNRRWMAGYNPPDSEGYIRLTTHNRNASLINDSKLHALSAPEFRFEAEIEGEFTESAFPADRILRLKKGAQVMFVKNDSGSDRRYYNGLIGTVASISEEKITVRPLGLDDAETIEVDRAEWDNMRYVVDDDTGKITQEKTGTFRQYPLQLAWAITIHKSQGLTFDRAIIDAAHSFAPGQTYVALSRCRSLEGLLLDSPVPPGAVITDTNINDFIGLCENNVPDSERVDSLKNEYLFALLSDLFDFETLKRSFDDFSRYVKEYLVPIHPGLELETENLRHKIEESLCMVGRRFTEQYNGASIRALLAEPSSRLAARIRKGCEYFLEITDEIREFLRDIPKDDIGNRDYATRLDNTFDALSYILSLKSLLLASMAKTPFSIGTFLQAKAMAVLTLDETPRAASRQRRNKATASADGNADNRRSENDEHPAKERRAAKEKKEKKPKGYSTFETLRLFREGKDIPRIAAERGLKESTIASHLSELMALGRVRLEEVIDTATLETLSNAFRVNPEAEYSEIYNTINIGRPDNPIPRYMLSIFIKAKKNENPGMS